MDRELQEANDELKNAQQQLIEQERLATLGQLTAGIAHELKNPLNFIINFSEVSIELLKEINEVKTEEEKNKLLADLANNLDRINHHGKRAESILKNILNTSRSGAGEKSLTNLNQLCSEYFELTYHSIRATNLGFNCELKKELSPDLPEINIVSQDISRVLLNIFSNAFYAVKEKRTKESKSNKHYKPEVLISTSLIRSPQSSQVVIRIRDNGIGIPEEVREKIFNPFFTTKPVGQGTGLGLSISYDIIKQHNGELKMNSKENEFTEFTITLPC